MTTTEIPSVASAPNAREAAIDTQLAELWQAAGSLRSKLDSTRVTLAGMLGIRGEYVRRQRVIRETMEEILPRIDALLASDETLFHGYNRRQVEQYRSAADEIPAALAANKAEAAPLEAVYAAERWSRFFLVTSSAGGHIHSSMSCSTCRFDTGFAWLPTLSGLTEADAVAEHGAILCTVCYPSAPVEWTNAHEVAAEAKAADKCPGSGTGDFDQHRVTSRTGSGRGVCRHCGEYVTITSRYAIRAHKPAKEES